MRNLMIRKLAIISIFTLAFLASPLKAGTTGSEELKGSGNQDTQSWRSS